MGTARALAKLHSLVAEGKLLKAETLQKLSKPVIVDKVDLVLTVPESKGKGFVYTKNSKVLLFLVGWHAVFLFLNMLLSLNLISPGNSLNLAFSRNCSILACY